MNTSNLGLGRISIPLVTPFDANEDINLEAYAKLIDYVIENDMGDSIISTGTTGEASSLMFEERVTLHKAAVSAGCSRHTAVMKRLLQSLSTTPPFSAKKAIHPTKRKEKRRLKENENKDIHRRKRRNNRASDIRAL